jgi:hypothetical protein
MEQRQSGGGLTLEEVDVFARGLYYLASVDNHVDDREVKLIEEFLRETGSALTMDELKTRQFSLYEAVQVLETTFLRRIFVKAAIASGPQRRRVQRRGAARAGHGGRRVRPVQRRVRRPRARGAAHQPAVIVPPPDRPSARERKQQTMGILGFIKSQLIDIIEWTDNTNYTLVYKFPDEDHEVKNGAKLICRENQAAILVNEGQMADIFGPGTHTLSTQNVPVLSRLKGWKYGF